MTRRSDALARDLVALIGQLIDAKLAEALPAVMPTEDRAHSLTEAARRLSLGRSSLYRLIHSGEIATAEIGGRRVITQSAIEAFLSARSKQYRPRPLKAG